MTNPKVIVQVSVQIAEHLKELIEIGVVSRGELLTMKLGDIKRKYFIGADIDDIMDAISTI